MALPELFHWSASPLQWKPGTAIVRNARPDGMKPTGLWVSSDGPDSWESWCRGQEYCLGNLAHKHRVTLKRKAKILHISTPQEFDAFCAWYTPPLWLGGKQLPPTIIDWERVAAMYQGILIAPHLPERHHDGPIWYYIWDCASGCIWDANAISSIELVNLDPRLPLTEGPIREGIRAFLQSRQRNAWVGTGNAEGVVKVYLRRSARNKPGTKEFYSALDIANVDITPPGQGTFTRLLADITQLAIEYGFLALYVENVLDPRFANFFRKRGWLEVNSDPFSPSFFFMLPAQEGKEYAVAD